MLLLSTEKHLHVELPRHFKKKKDSTLVHLAYQYDLDAVGCSGFMKQAFLNA